MSPAGRPGEAMAPPAHWAPSVASLGLHGGGLRVNHLESAHLPPFVRRVLSCVTCHLREAGYVTDSVPGQCRSAHLHPARHVSVFLSSCPLLVHPPFSHSPLPVIEEKHSRDTCWPWVRKTLGRTVLWEQGHCSGVLRRQGLNSESIGQRAVWPGSRRGSLDRK